MKNILVVWIEDQSISNISLSWCLTPTRGLALFICWELYESSRTSTKQKRLGRRGWSIKFEEVDFFHPKNARWSKVKQLVSTWKLRVQLFKVPVLIFEEIYSKTFVAGEKSIPGSTVFPDSLTLCLAANAADEIKQTSASFPLHSS